MQMVLPALRLGKVLANKGYQEAEKTAWLEMLCDLSRRRSSPFKVEADELCGLFTGQR